MEDFRRPASSNKIIAGHTNNAAVAGEVIIVYLTAADTR